LSAAYRVQARNLSHASENRIHDDEVARRFGFAGGLVPGVEVYAYMTHLPVARWGAAWLERGSAECRFAKPVYDGRMVEVSASEAGGALSIAVESEGERCATGTAALPDESAPAPAVRPAVPIPAPKTGPTPARRRSRSDVASPLGRSRSLANISSSISPTSERASRCICASASSIPRSCCAFRIPRSRKT
jgi:hypothetical protein